MIESHAVLGLLSVGMVVVAAVIVRLKLESWLGAQRLAEINAEIDEMQTE